MWIPAHVTQFGWLVVIDGVENKVEDDFAVIVPAGACHNVKNTGDEPLQFYSIYGPPEHKDQVVHKTKDQAEGDHDNDEWDGKTTEQGLSVDGLLTTSGHHWPPGWRSAREC